jgi:hypothetical protein
MLPDRTIPRPTFAQVFSSAAEHEVLHWIQHQSTVLPDDQYTEFVKTLPTGPLTLRDLLLSLATETKKDAFSYASALKDKLGWPVDTTLVEIFTSQIKMTDRKHLREQTMAWVMKTGTRWKLPVGTTKDIRDPQVSYMRAAKVVSIDKVTASAVIEFINDPKRTMTVYAEDIAA